MIKIFKIIFRMPLLPLVFVYICYVIYKVYKNTDMTELAIKEENGEELLSAELKSNINRGFDKYKVHINVLNMILWFLIINHIK
jgi:hypothetical protein